MLYLSQQTTVAGPNNFSRIYMHRLRTWASSKATAKRQLGTIHQAQQDEPLAWKVDFAVPNEGSCCTCPSRLPLLVQIIFPEFTCIDSVPRHPPRLQPTAGKAALKWPNNPTHSVANLSLLFQTKVGVVLVPADYRCWSK